MSIARTDATEGLTVADVMHGEVASWPASATVREVRGWFAVSASRRLALLADAGRYLGALTPGDVTGDADGDRPAVELAGAYPTVAPDAPASAGLDVVLTASARRVPVVDRDGCLVGVLAVTTDLQSFACRPS
jgi:CBS-domain-containing membrane protein